MKSEGQEIEPWMEHTDKAIATICKTACEALSPIADIMELLACPFCGSADGPEPMRETPTAYWIVCCSCGTQGPDRKERNDAIKAWNTRQLPEQPAVRRLCQTHPDVNYKTAWGCPECVREMRELLTAAANALRSYQYGNASTDLAESVANRIERQLSPNK